MRDWSEDNLLESLFEYMTASITDSDFGASANADRGSEHIYCLSQEKLCSDTYFLR